MIIVVNSLLGHHEMYLSAFKKEFMEAKVWSTVRGIHVDKVFDSKRSLIKHLVETEETVFFLSLNEWQYYLLRLRALNIHGIFYHQSENWRIKNILRVSFFRLSRVKVNLLLYRPRLWRIILGDNCNVIPDPYMGMVYGGGKKSRNDKIRIGFLGEISERKGFYRFIDLIDNLNPNIFEFICHGNSIINKEIVDNILLKRDNLVEYSLSRLEESIFQEKLSSCDLVFMDYELTDGSSGILSLSALFRKPVLYRHNNSFLSKHIFDNKIGIEVQTLYSINNSEEILKIIPIDESFIRFNKRWNNTDAFFEQISI